MNKGADSKVFVVPDNFLTDKYRPLGESLTSRFGAEAGEMIPVSNISIPNMSIPESLGRDEQFSVFIPRHRRIAKHLINIFMGTG